MGMYSANSDRDYDDECHGPYGDAIQLTCADCKGVAWVPKSEGMPPGPVLCDRCGYERDIRAAQSRAVQAFRKGSAA